MRPYLLLAALPLLAAPPKGKPVKVTLSHAAVVFGAGVEPRGPMPPARFHVDVAVEGLKGKVKPTFKAWRVLASDLPGIERGANLRFVRGGLGLLKTELTEPTPGTLTLRGEWPGAPKEDERLLVEAWVGARRVGYGVTSLSEHALPARNPKDQTEP